MGKASKYDDDDEMVELGTTVEAKFARASPVRAEVPSAADESHLQGVMSNDVDVGDAVQASKPSEVRNKNERRCQIAFRQNGETAPAPVNGALPGAVPAVAQPVAPKPKAKKKVVVEGEAVSDLDQLKAMFGSVVDEGDAGEEYVFHRLLWFSYSFAHRYRGKVVNKDWEREARRRLMIKQCHVRMIDCCDTCALTYGIRPLKKQPNCANSFELKIKVAH
jgi:hypothetical protein